MAESARRYNRKQVLTTLISIQESATQAIEKLKENIHCGEHLHDLHGEINDLYLSFDEGMATVGRRRPVRSEEVLKADAEIMYQASLKDKEIWKAAERKNRRSTDDAIDIVRDHIAGLYAERYTEKEWDVIHEQLYLMIDAGLN